MIRSYTLDCGCFFEHSRKAGCSSHELTRRCAAHVAQGKWPEPLSSSELPPSPFLSRPQAGGPSRDHQECPGCDDPMCHKYTGKVTQRVTTLGELLGAPMDDRNTIESLNGPDPLEHTQPILPPYTHAVPSDVERLQDLIGQHHAARNEINAVLDRMGSKAYLIFPRIEIRTRSDER